MFFLRPVIAWAWGEAGGPPRHEFRGLGWGEVVRSARGGAEAEEEVVAGFGSRGLGGAFEHAGGVVPSGLAGGEREAEDLLGAELDRVGAEGGAGVLTHGEGGADWCGGGGGDAPEVAGVFGRDGDKRSAGEEAAGGVGDEFDHARLGGEEDLGRETGGDPACEGAGGGHACAVDPGGGPDALEDARRGASPAAIGEIDEAGRDDRGEHRVVAGVRSERRIVDEETVQAVELVAEVGGGVGDGGEGGAGRDRDVGDAGGGKMRPGFGVREVVHVECAGGKRGEVSADAGREGEAPRAGGEEGGNASEDACIGEDTGVGDPEAFE